MSDNQLIYKIVPTIIENNVEFDLQNNQAEYIFTTKKSFIDEVSNTSGPGGDGIVPLPGINGTFANNPIFIELIASAPISLRFIAFTVSGDFLTNIGPTTYVAGNIRGHTFDVENTTLETIKIHWSFYQND